MWWLLLVTTLLLLPIITNNIAETLSSPLLSLTVVIHSGLWGVTVIRPAVTAGAPQEKLFTYPYPVCLLRTVVRWRAGGGVSYNMPGHILESLPAQP